MTRSGTAGPADLKWNRVSVNSTMERFKKIAEEVEDNRIKAYVEAGGLKKSGELWIDSYCGIKTAIKATIACHVKSRGDEPKFVLELNNEPIDYYSAEQLDKAFEDWKAARELAMEFKETKGTVSKVKEAKARTKGTVRRVKEAKAGTKGANKVTVVLTSVGDKPIEVISEVHRLTGLDPREILDLVASAPVAIPRMGPEEIKRRLEVAGATVELRPKEE